MNKDIKRKLYFGLAASGLVYAMGGSSAALAVPLPPFHPRAVPSDFDGDGATDLAVIRPSHPAGLNWHALLSSSGTRSNVQWGANTDIVVPGDYDGDGKTDQAVYRPENGNWFLLQSSAGFSAHQWGSSPDTPVPADYDGDGKTDLAVVRVGDIAGGGQLAWYVLHSDPKEFCARTFGRPTDIPVPGDYNVDGITEMAIFRPDTGEWRTLGQDCVHVLTPTVVKFGLPGDEPVPGDYDGDGKFDRAVWRPATGSNGTWRVLKSSGGQMPAFALGLPSDRRVPGDYDHDGKWDFAVYRPSTSTDPNSSKWIVRHSTTGKIVETFFGNQTDLPVPAAYTFREPLPRRTGF